jgi:BlaI family penicillinase repressor
VETPLPGGALEWAVLGALFDLGRATVREVHARVGEPSGLAYTTTAKVLERLRRKRLVARRRSGRTFVYRPTVGRDELEETHLRGSLGPLLGRDPRPAIATLVDAMESLDPELLDELARAVAKRRRSRHGS